MALHQTARGYHDIGGLPAGPIDLRTRELQFWEKQIAAMRVLLGEGRLELVPLEELRNAFETFGAQLYQSLGFFERMLESTVRILAEKGIVERAALASRALAIEARMGGARVPRLLAGEGSEQSDPYGGTGYVPIAGPDAPPTGAELACHALRELLIEEGLLMAEDVRIGIERIEAPGVHLGARIVVRSWLDPAFRDRILADGMAACREYSIPFFDGQLTVIENTPAVHNVVVCTLCSCYPRNLLGQPPAWYVSKAYRSRVVREPRAVLAEFGTELPADVTIRVHDSTAELRYLILPMRPEGTLDWTEERLAELVTRDCMIGVAQAKSPDA